MNDSYRKVIIETDKEQDNIVKVSDDDARVIISPLETDTAKNDIIIINHDQDDEGDNGDSASVHGECKE